ncbi:coiled-coil domain-containing protein [Enterococcus sp. AZ102]|uniref:coiled-coil domain-containing protein n=1 Tax=Enterococcus sp. AZ102 TaxID=2774865 RepID=UPI003F202FD6
MKKNKQARIKTSLIVLVASALIGGITVNQISATSTSGIVDTTTAYRDDSFDSLSAKKAQESLASTQQQKRTELEKQKKAQELKEQEAKKVQEQLEKQKAEQEQLEQAAQEQVAKQAQETANLTEQTATKQASNLQTTTQEQNASEVPETTQETTQQPVAQETQSTRTVDTQPQIPSVGLYIDGICAQIGSYNVDGGQVPTYTPLAYHWNTPQMASHNYYLVDNSNSTGLGQKVLALQIGDPVYLNGHLYHVTSSVTVYPGQYASDYFDFSHGLYIQTCYGASASEGMRTVILD